MARAPSCLDVTPTCEDAVLPVVSGVLTHTFVDVTTSCLGVTPSCVSVRSLNQPFRRFITCEDVTLPLVSGCRTLVYGCHTSGHGVTPSSVSVAPLSQSEFKFPFHGVPSLLPPVRRETQPLLGV